jgi:dolichyl-phosphate-mannose-protein mannosyltransferase
MKPAAIAVDIGSDTEFPAQYEPIPYTTANYHWTEQHQQLPLHYMSEETARRRVKASGGADLGSPLQKEGYDDESKEAYHKHGPPSARVASGRLPQPHLPPPTSIVSLVLI